MSFLPVIPLAGYSGWRFLQSSLETQKTAHAASPQIARDATYFREKIGQVSSAEDLVSDRRLLTVALTAFGLEDDINNTYFIQKVLSDGTLSPDALANKLSDKRYLALSEAFGFGDFDTPNTKLSTFPDTIVSGFKRKSFEAAVGAQNNDLRLALNIANGLEDTLARASSDTGKWFSIMGDVPVRTVFETAMNLPSSFGALALDTQLEQFQSRADSLFGSAKAADFSNAEQKEKLIRLFLINSQSAQFSAQNSSAQTALTLLGGGAF